MLTYNNNHIFTGYLKELLANDPLPNYNIYKDDDKVYPSYIFSPGDNPHHCWYNPYLKDGKLQYYCWNGKTGWDGKSLTNIPEYEWKTAAEVFQDATNKNKNLNTNKKLVIKNTIYDTETHRYLGNYLRFKKDSTGLNLMSLYNCFTDDVCLKAKFNIFQIPGTEDYRVKINTLKDQNLYKLYKIPIKFFEKYTIAIDSEAGAELVCGFFNQYQIDADDLSGFYALTYKKYSSLRFHSPIVYDKLAASLKDNRPLHELLRLSAMGTTSDLKHQSYAGMLNNLMLFIKVPIFVNSSIVVLEGDYTGYNNNFWDSLIDPRLEAICATNIEDSSNTIAIAATGASSTEYNVAVLIDLTPHTAITRYTNHWVTNYDIYNSEAQISTADKSIFKPITNLQLLEANTLKSYPFSDRLMEYLSENAIGPLETEISENIERVKKVILQNREAIATESDTYKEKIMWKLEYPDLGVWEGKMQRILYDYMQTKNSKNKQQSFSAIRDNLGFVDKDTEINYISFIPEKNSNNQIEIKNGEPQFKSVSSLGAVE